MSNNQSGEGIPAFSRNQIKNEPNATNTTVYNSFGAQDNQFKKLHVATLGSGKNGDSIGGNKGFESPEMVITPMALAPTMSQVVIDQGLIAATFSEDYLEAPHAQSIDVQAFQNRVIKTNSKNGSSQRFQKQEKSDVSYNNNASTVPLQTSVGEQIISGDMIIQRQPSPLHKLTQRAATLSIRAKTVSNRSEGKEVGVTFHTVEHNEDSLIDLANFSIAKDSFKNSSNQNLIDTNHMSPSKETKADEVIKPPEIISVLDNGTSVELGQIAGLTDLHSLKSTMIPTKVPTSRESLVVTEMVLAYDNSLDDELNNKGSTKRIMLSNQSTSKEVSPMKGNNFIKKPEVDTDKNANLDEFKLGSIITVNLSKIPNQSMPSVPLQNRVHTHSTFMAGPTKKGSFQAVTTANNLPHRQYFKPQQQKHLLFKNNRRKQRKSQDSRKLASAVNVVSASPNKIDSNDELKEQTDRVEKIKSNLKLMNQIMSHNSRGSQNDFSTMYGRIQPVYMPLPNHNFVQRGDRSSSSMYLAPAKTQYYQIQQSGKKEIANRERGSQIRTVMTRPRTQQGYSKSLSNQTEKERMRKLSINKKSIGQMMRTDMTKMINAQDNIMRDSIYNTMLTDNADISQLGEARRQTQQIEVELRPQDHQGHYTKAKTLSNNHARSNGMTTNLVISNSMTVNSLDLKQVAAINTLKAADTIDDEGYGQNFKKVITGVALKKDINQTGINSLSKILQIVNNNNNNPSPTSGEFNPIDEGKNIQSKHVNVPDVPNLQTRQYNSAFASQNQKDPIQYSKALEIGARENSTGYMKEVMGLEENSVSSLLIIQARNTGVLKSYGLENNSQNQLTLINEPSGKSRQEEESKQSYDGHSITGDSCIDEKDNLSGIEEVIRTRETQSDEKDEKDEKRSIKIDSEEFVVQGSAQQPPNIQQNAQMIDGFITRGHTVENLNSDIKLDLITGEIMTSYDDPLLNQLTFEKESLLGIAMPHPLPYQYEQSNYTDTHFNSNIFKLDDEFNIKPDSTTTPNAEKINPEIKAVVTQKQHISNDGDKQKMNFTNMLQQSQQTSEQSMTGIDHNIFDSRKDTLKIGELAKRQQSNQSSLARITQIEQYKNAVQTQEDEATPMFQKQHQKKNSGQINSSSRNIDDVTTNRGLPQQQSGSSYYRGIEVQEFDPKINGMVIDVRVSKDGVDSRYKKQMTGQNERNTQYDNMTTLERSGQTSQKLIESSKNNAITKNGKIIGNVPKSAYPRKTFQKLGSSASNSVHPSKSFKAQQHQTAFGAGILEDGLDMRSSQNRQSLSPENSKVAISKIRMKNTGANKGGRNNNDLLPQSMMVSKKALRSRSKKFVLQFNDFTSQQQNIGQDMLIVGQTYQQPVQPVVPMIRTALTSANLTIPIVSQHSVMTERLNQQTTTQQTQGQNHDYLDYQKQQSQESQPHQQSQQSQQSQSANTTQIKIGNHRITSQHFHSRQGSSQGLSAEIIVPKMMLSSSSSAAMHQKKIDNQRQKRKQSASSTGLKSQATRAPSRESTTQQRQQMSTTSQEQFAQQRPQTVNAKKNVNFHHQKMLQRQTMAGSRLRVNRTSAPDSQIASFDQNFVLSSNEAATSSQKLQQNSVVQPYEQQYSLLATSSQQSQRNQAASKQQAQPQPLIYQQMEYSSSRASGFFQNHKPMSQLFKSGQTNANLRGGAEPKFDPRRLSAQSTQIEFHQQSSLILMMPTTKAALGVPKLSTGQMLYSVPVMPSSFSNAQTRSGSSMPQSKGILSKTQNQFTSIMGQNTIKQVCCNFPEQQSQHETEETGMSNFRSQAYDKGVVNLM